MGHKNQAPLTFNWQSTDPSLTLFPQPQGQAAGSVPSGVIAGTMSSTNTIYTNIIDISRMDNLSIDAIWTGTPTGTLSVLLSGSGLVFSTVPATSFTPTLVSPSGSAAKLNLNMPLIAAKYIMLSYVNVSGSGTIKAYMQIKDLN